MQHVQHQIDVGIRLDTYAISLLTDEVDDRSAGGAGRQASGGSGRGIGVTRWKAGRL